MDVQRYKQIGGTATCPECNKSICTRAQKINPKLWHISTTAEYKTISIYQSGTRENN
jgi:hypothetical protein